MTGTLGTLRARRHADEIPLRGGHLALDLANTMGWHASDAPSEWLVDYDELARWTEHAGLHTAAESRRLRTLATASPAEAARVLAAVTDLRERLYRVCRAVIAGAIGESRDLATLHARYAESIAHTRLVAVAHGYALVPADDHAPSLDAPLYRLARAAVELLTSDALPLMRQCESVPCGWLFLDRSRNRSRRWCASEECGNRERVRRHLARG